MKKRLEQSKDSLEKSFLEHFIYNFFKMPN